MHRARHFEIYRSPRDPSKDVKSQDEFPWYVAETTFGDDRDNYGRMSTYEEAIGLMESMLAYPHELCSHEYHKTGSCIWE